MSELKVKRCRPIRMEICVPGDPGISHRAVIMAALANGPSEISGFLPSQDCLRTVQLLRALGIGIEELDSTAWGPTRLRVHGQRGVLASPAVDLDCGRSASTLRLLAGVLAGQAEGFRARLTGDAPSFRQAVRPVLEPLTLMGARIRFEAAGDSGPLCFEGSRLHGLDYHCPVANAEVTSAILLATLFADGRSTVTEPGPCPDHTQKMLPYFRVKTVRQESHISIWGNQILESRDFEVPGDMSCAAFWVVAAAAMPGAHLCIHHVGLNVGRTGLLKVLIRMGAQITEVIDHCRCGEPVGRIEIHGGRLRGTTIDGTEIPRVLDELPAIAIAAALAEGKTTIRDAGELRVQASDQITAISHNLRLMGAGVQEFLDGLEIAGGGSLKAARIDPHGDPRIGMAFAIAGLHAEGETLITGGDCIQSGYPGFTEEIRQIVAAKNKGSYTPVINSLNPASAKDS